MQGNIFSRLLLVLVLSAAASFAQDTCCPTDAVVLPVPMPPGQTAYDYGGMLAAGINSPMLRPTDCPVPLDFLSYEGSINLDQMVDDLARVAGAEDDEELAQLRAQMHNVVTDYVFIGTLTAPGAVSRDGKLYGSFVLNVKMHDNCPSRQANVLKEGQVSWDGSEWGIMTPGVTDVLLHQLGESFMPVDQLIYDYEGRPEQCQIEPEKDQVEPGETISITVSGLKDGKGRTPKPWQPLIVEVDQGDILNGDRYDKGMSAFLCEGGEVDVQYKAPDDCPKEKKIQIKVSNSCESCPERFVHFLPEKELASKEITINCAFQLTANHRVTMSYETYSEQKQTTGGVSFHVKEDNSIEGNQPQALHETSSGTVDECTIQTSAVADVVVTGQLVPNDGNPYLDITLQEIWNVTMVMICPDGSVNQALPPQTVKHEHLIFPLEDGYTLTQPFEGEGGEGFYSWTLDVP